MPNALYDVSVWLSGLTLLGIIINAFIARSKAKDEREFWKIQHEAKVEEEKLKRDWELEDRLYKDRLEKKVDLNTVATIDIGVKADAAYKEANNINQKIAAVQDVRRNPPSPTKTGRRDTD